MTPARRGKGGGLKKFRCRRCRKQFANRFTLARHVTHKVCQQKKKRSLLECDLCTKTFLREDALSRHKQRYHPDCYVQRARTYCCGICDSSFSDVGELETHRATMHTNRSEFELVNSAHRRQCQLLRLVFPDRVLTMDQGLFFAYDQMKQLLRDMLKEYPYFKANFVLCVDMSKYDENGELLEGEAFPFRAFQLKVARGEKFAHGLRDVCNDFERNVESFLMRGSGWTVRKPLHLDVEIVLCEPLAGSAAACSLHVADYLRSKGISPINGRVGDDGKCFLYAVAKHFTKDDSRLPDFVENHLVYKKEVCTKKK